MTIQNIIKNLTSKNNMSILAVQYRLYSEIDWLLVSFQSSMDDCLEAINKYNRVEENTTEAVKDLTNIIFKYEKLIAFWQNAKIKIKSDFEKSTFKKRKTGQKLKFIDS